MRASSEAAFDADGQVAEAEVEQLLVGQVCPVGWHGSRRHGRNITLERESVSRGTGPAAPAAACRARSVPLTGPEPDLDHRAQQSGLGRRLLRRGRAANERRGPDQRRRRGSEAVDYLPARAGTDRPRHRGVSAVEQARQRRRQQFEASRRCHPALRLIEKLLEILQRLVSREEVDRGKARLRIHREPPAVSRSLVHGTGAYAAGAAQRSGLG